MKSGSLSFLQKQMDSCRTSFVFLIIEWGLISSKLLADLHLPDPCGKVVELERRYAVVRLGHTGSYLLRFCVLHVKLLHQEGHGFFLGDKALTLPGTDQTFVRLGHLNVCECVEKNNICHPAMCMPISL